MKRFNIITTAIVLCLCFTKCSSGYQTVTQTTEAESETIEAQTKESETKIWSTAYEDVINNTLKECTEKYPHEINHGQYGLYDFDNDSIPELFLEVYGSTTPDNYIHIYNFDGDKAVCIDSMQSSHSQVYGTNRENAFLVESVWMGVYAWNICELKNGEFISNELASYYPDGFGDSIEPEENPLPDMGYEIKEIEFYNLDDLTGIENEKG